MADSTFIEFVGGNALQTVVNETSATINGSESPLVYFHKEMLTQRYEPTLTVSSLNSDTVYVAADVVSTDSSLPLKTRDAVEVNIGTIPKIGLSFTMQESTIKKIDIMRRQGLASLQGQVSELIFQDPVRAVIGMNEQAELMFLQGLSSGVTLIEAGADRAGQSIRFNYHYPESNIFGVSKPWSDVSSDPIADIDNVIDRASEKGVIPNFIHMDKATFNAFVRNTKVKEFFTYATTQVLISGTPLGAPSLSALNVAMQDKYGLTIRVYNRSVNIEKNGVKTVYNPWESRSVVFTTGVNVGSFVWSDLPEATRAALQVTYATVDNWILISKYSETNPFKEYTTASGFGIPVIENVNSIFKLNTEEATLDTQTEGDSTFTYKTLVYTKASVVAAIKLAKPSSTVTISTTDAKLLNTINGLSNAEITTFEANITLD